MPALGELGRDVLGPAFCLHLERVIDRTDEHDLDRLLFVAREGFLLQRAHALLVEQLHPRVRPAGSYLYLSRLSTSLASARGLGVRELRLGFLKQENSVLTVLRVFGLYDARMLELVYEAGVADPARPIYDWWRSDAVTRLLAHEPLQREVRARADAARSLLRRYLAQEGMFTSKRAALVDIGWSGTIQNNLSRAFARDPAFPDLRGIYLGLMRDQWQRYSPEVRGRKEGVLAHHARLGRLRDRAPFYFLEIFEQSARAPHGTTLGYEEQGGRVVPITKERGDDRAAERRADGAIAELQRGVLDCAGAWRRGDFDREKVLARLERFVFFPTRRQLDALASLHHTDDWGFDTFGGLVRGGAVLRHPGRWLDELRRAYWKPGFVHASGGPVSGRVLGHLYHAYARLKPRPPVW